MSLRASMLFLALSAFTASAGSAQQPRASSSGAWFSAGVGGGWVRVSCAICRTDRNAGPSAALRFGTTLRPGLRIGGELDGWTRSSDDVRAQIVVGGAAAYIQPDPTGGLYLKAGAGMVHYGIDPDIGTNLVGLILGAGYELPISPNLSITNSIGLIASSFGALRSGSGTVADDVSVSMLQLGIALTHR